MVLSTFCRAGGKAVDGWRDDDDEEEEEDEKDEEEFRLDSTSENCDLDSSPSSLSLDNAFPSNTSAVKNENGQNFSMKERAVIA